MLPCDHGLCKDCLLSCGWRDPDSSPTDSIATPAQGTKRPRQNEDGSGNVRRRAHNLWILTSTDSAGALWHANLEREVQRYTGYPLDETEITGDGQGGVWALTSTEGSGTLWHANLQREVERYTGYPLDHTKIAGDGQGGVWILTSTDGSGTLWHADFEREVNLYAGYPLHNTKMVGDGQGGVWLLTSTPVARKCR